MASSLLAVTLLCTKASILAHPVDRHIGRWISAPRLVPGTSQQPDGPLAGNGDFGVVLAGGRECCGGKCCGGAGVRDADLGLFFGKNDFWANGPAVHVKGLGEPWTHATPGYVTVRVGDAGGSGGGSSSGEQHAATRATPPTVSCPPAPAGFAAVPRTCPGDPTTCPSGSPSCGCSGQQINHGRCLSSPACFAAAHADCLAHPNCGSFAVAGLQHPAGQCINTSSSSAGLMWETYPLSSTIHPVKNPVWTSYVSSKPIPPPVGPMQVCLPGAGVCIDRYHHPASTGHPANPTQMNLWPNSGVTTWKDQLWSFTNITLRSGCTNPSCLGLQCVGLLSNPPGVIGMVSCADATAVLALRPELVGNGSSSYRIVQEGHGGKPTGLCLAVINCSFKYTGPNAFDLEACGGGKKCGTANLLWSIGPPHAPPPPPGPRPSPPSPPGLPFSATQELANARLNATSSVLGSGTLASTTIVATDKNLVMSRLRVELEGDDPVQVTVTLSTPNEWHLPTVSGSASGGRMWLRKDTCNTVENALTLAACDEDVLVYNGLRNVSVDRAAGGLMRVYNASASGYLCLQLEQPGAAHGNACPHAERCMAHRSAVWGG